MVDTPDTPVADGLEQAVAEVEEHIALIAARVKSTWKDAATKVHPDLQPVGYKILGAIVRLGDTNAYVLSETLELDKSLVSRQVGMLESVGLVTSRADAKDGRARVLSATPAATERVEAVAAERQERLREILRSRPESDVRAFATILRLLSEQTLS